MHWEVVRKYPEAVAYLFFILLSAGAVALFRSFLGMESAASPRYILLQVAFVSIVYLLTLRVFPRFSFLPWLMIIVLLPFYIIRNKSINGYFEPTKQYLINSILQYRIQPDEMKDPLMDGQILRHQLDKSIRSGIYKAPTLQDLSCLYGIKEINTHKLPTPQVRYQIESIERTQSTINIHGWIFPSDAQFKSHNSTLVLASEKNTVSINTRNYNRNDVFDAFKKEFPYISSKSGFSTTIPMGILPKGSYYIGWYFLNSDKAEAYVLSDYCIDID
jgi:hypothetical protein